MDRSLSSPTAPSGGELLLTSALLSVYVGLRVATAALAMAGSRPRQRLVGNQEHPNANSS
jgi:hypothetical protein